MTTEAPLLLLIDGSSYLYRAFHALPPLTNSRGEPTGAIYGVINMLKRLLNDYTPTYLAVVFDAPGKNFRHQLYPEYKAHRPSMDPELQRQVAPLHAIIKAMGVPLLSIPGVEADDVIGTLVWQATHQNMRCLISTGDKDFAQLVDGSTTLINTMSGASLDEAGVREKFGVAPDQMVDYLTLVGDSSDNVAGVPGVGPKTAAKWLQHYGSLAQLLLQIAELKGKVGDQLRMCQDLLAVTRQVVTIRHDLHLDWQVSQLTRQPVQARELAEWFNRLEFRNWLAELSQNGSLEASAYPQQSEVSVEHPPGEYADNFSGTHLSEVGNRPGDQTMEVAKGCYSCILTLEEFQLWLERLQIADKFAFNLEIDEADPQPAKVSSQQAEIPVNSVQSKLAVGHSLLSEQAGSMDHKPGNLGGRRIIGVSLALQPGEAVYLPCDQSDLVVQSISCDDLLALLRPFWEDQAKTKLGYNLKVALEILADYGITVGGPLYDTMLESYLLDNLSRQRQPAILALKYLGQSIKNWERLIGKGGAIASVQQLDLAEATAHAGLNVDLILQLHQVMWSQITENPAEQWVFEHLDTPLLAVLTRMERYGVGIDRHLLAGYSAELDQQLGGLEQTIYQEAGVVFNINSPAQLQTILYDRLGLPMRHKTAKGQPSTAEPVLQELAANYLLPELILRYRSLAKLKSTYADALPMQINPTTGRIHTSYNQTVTATGRLSSTHPNLQNIPIRTVEGRRIRRAFTAPPGYCLLAADYSQIELRVMAHLSEDPGLIQALTDGVDIHRLVASEILGIDPAAVTEEERRRAKTINFGLIYGMSAFGLAQRLGISRQQAEEYIGRYFSRYPKVRDYMEETKRLAMQQGYVQSIYGRPIRIENLKSSPAKRQAASRAAINAPIQGSAADIIKLAMVAIDDWIEKSNWRMAMVMQVHDELVFEVSAEQVAEVAPIIRRQMEQVANLKVPLVVDIGWGDNWDEAH